MKLIKKEYSKISQCRDFWAWLWFTRDYPFGAMYSKDSNWFKYCGSDSRVLIRRRFGWSWDIAYNRNEIGLFYTLLFLIKVVLLCFLGIEIFLITMY